MQAAQPFPAVTEECYTVGDGYKRPPVQVAVACRGDLSRSGYEQKKREQ